MRYFEKTAKERTGEYAKGYNDGIKTFMARYVDEKDKEKRQWALKNFESSSKLMDTYIKNNVDIKFKGSI